MQKFIPVCLLWALSACAPGDADYAQAVRDNWPNEQAAQRARANFFNEQAKGFEESSRQSAKIAASFGREDSGDDDSISASHKKVAEEGRAEAAEAEWIAGAQISDVKDIRCADAAPRPGKNCEMTLELKGTDNQVRTLPVAYRFDKVDGTLTIVGADGN